MKCSIVPYEGSKPYVFFSFCHKDEETVYPIIELLSNEGFRVWYDSGIMPGADWPDTIAQKISQCGVCIAAISQGFVNSHNCRNELTFAIENRIKIVSLIIENTELPMGIRMQLSNYQNIKAYEITRRDMLNRLIMGGIPEDCKGMPEGNIQGNTSRDERREVLQNQHLINGERKTDGNDYPVLFHLTSQTLYKGKYPLTVIGRSARKCDIVLSEFTAISNDHADVLIKNDRCLISDRGSTNGTRINGITIEKGVQYQIDDFCELTLANEKFLLSFGECAAFFIEHGTLAVISSESTKEQKIIFDKKFILGRENKWKDGVLSDQKVSRKHSEITFEDGIYYLRDISSNGTVLNDRKLVKDEIVCLHDGDDICVGKDHFSFRQYRVRAVI